MSEKRSVYRKSESGDDSDDENRDNENNASNSGSGNSSGSDSEDGTASESSVNSSAHGRSSHGSNDHQNSSDASDDDHNHKKHEKRRSISKTVTSSPKKLEDETTQHSNNSRINGISEDDDNNNNNNSDSESNSDTSSSGSDSNDEEQESGNDEATAHGKQQNLNESLCNVSHNTSGISVTSSSSTTTNTTTTSNTSNAANNSDNNEVTTTTHNDTINRSDGDDASNNDSNDDNDDDEKESDNESTYKSNSNTKVTSSKLSAIAKTAKRQRVISDEEEEKESDRGSDAASNKSSAEEDEVHENDDDDDEDDDGDDDDEEQESPTESSSSSSEDDEDDYQPKRSTRQVRKPPSNQERDKKPLKKKRKQDWDTDESNESDENDDSDESTSRRRKIPAASSKSRQKQQSRSGGGSRKRRTNDSDESEDDTKRTGTRRAAAAVSYKEASDVEKTDSEDLLDYEYDESQAEAAAAALEEEDKSETIERVLAQRLGKKGCTGNKTTIYAVEENEDDNKNLETITTTTSTITNDQQQQQQQNNENTENNEVQYLIKWKGWSYIHNTWESEETLREQKAKGMKKLENFIKKEQDIEYWRRYAGPEDIDYFECQLELQNELLKSYNNVDRIIARNEKEDGTCEYLCKWQSLPYAESTWEDATLVLQKWKQCVERFDEREMSKCTPSRQCKVLRHRPKFYRIKDQPDFIPDSNLTLRDYQLDGLNWLLHSWCKENSVILADEMGLGKTIQTICFLYSLFKFHHLYGPFLCVVPLSTMTAWQREFQLWAPDMNVVTYLGDVKSREMIRQYEWQFDGSKRLKFNCILTTYEIVLKDKLFLGTLQWAALLVDEAHRLKNDDSLLYKSLKEFETNHRLLITGTPLQNSLKELWALLHFIMPEKFLTWEDFESEHGNAADKGYTRLHQQLEPFILRRVKKDVEKSLPAKVEQILRVEMTSVQKQYYKWILTKNFDALRKGKRGSTSTFLNIVIELKKCCNHAALIRPSEFELMGMQQEEALQTLLKGSGKLVLLDKLLCRLRDTGHRVLIFSQMVRMLDVLSDYLQKRHFPFQRLDGSIKGEMRRQALDHFNAEGSQDFCFLLSTRAGGLGINLATADTVIIFDSDWNPQNDLQAQARAHRIGQKNQVNIYRLVTARSVEEQIVERAKQKMVLDHLVIQRMDTTGRTVLDKSGASSTNSNPFDKDDLSAILKFGAEELFKDEQENDDELVCDIDEILRRAETRNEDPEMPGDDLLSAFKVASIVAFEEEPDAGATKSNNSPENDIEEDTKDWDEIIPEDFRKIVEEKERAKEMEDLYLPPRRKTTTSGQPDSTPTKRGKKGQQDDSGDSDYDVGSDASGGEGDGRKRRGRATKEKINGFTDAELRRFIRSYKKFPAPLLRLEAIACDAELQEKPLAELKRIGQMLHDRCVQFLEEHKEETLPTTTTTTATATASKAANGNEETAATKQKRNRATYSIKLGGVSFNAKTLLTSEEELKPLNEIIPSSANERLAWTFDLKTRPANFDTEWGSEEDSKLLCGIYQYGIGSWEQMKLDPSLKLTDKILFNDVRKPQAKHLQSRAEYLLKIIKKNLELKKKGPKGGRQRKPRKIKETKNNNNEAAIATPESRSRRVSETHGGGGDASQTANSNANSKSEIEHDLSNDADVIAAGKSSSKKKRKSNAAGKTGKGAKKGNTSAAAAKVKKGNKPMHFTANNEPRTLEVLGDLDPTIFNECKEKMRPVKRALKALDRPDSSLTNQEQVKHTRDCLLAIGKQIDACLEVYNEADKKVWRSNLWYFVSKFTEHDAKKLFKIYKSLKETTKSKTKKNDSQQLATAAASPTKLNSQSPTKKSKDSKKSKKKDLVASLNGMVGDGDIKEKNKIKDKSIEKNAKKKKKDKDKDRDRDMERTKTSSTHHPMGDRFTAKGAGADHTDKSQRFNAAHPHKRKHEAENSDLNDSKSFKRNFDNRTSHDRNDERKKHRDEYYGGGNSHEGRSEWRDALNSPSSGNNRSMSERSRLSGVGGGGGGNYRDRTTSGGDNRSPYVDGVNERWSSHGRDRYGNSDYKRDRFDNYNNRSGGGGGSGGYHHRGNRDNRRPEKRRYPQNLPPHSLNYPGHYPPPIPGNFFMANGLPPPGALPLPPPAHATSLFRSDMRYPHGPNDWSSRDNRMNYSPEYRRSAGGNPGSATGNSGDYDRRPQT